MDYAEGLLLDSSCTVEDVSDVLGYEHAQHFSTAFKKFGNKPLGAQVGSKPYQYAEMTKEKVFNIDQFVDTECLLICPDVGVAYRRGIFDPFDGKYAHGIFGKMERKYPV